MKSELLAAADYCLSRAKDERKYRLANDEAKALELAASVLREHAEACDGFEAWLSKNRVSLKIWPTDERAAEHGFLAGAAWQRAKKGEGSDG